MNKIKYDVEYKIDLKIYPLEVIYRTCYSFTDKYYLCIKESPKNTVIVNIKSQNEENQNDVEGRFGNALIDFATRWSINKETSEIRNTLIKSALTEVKKNE